LISRALHPDVFDQPGRKPPFQQPVSRDFFSGEKGVPEHSRILLLLQSTSHV
jgi:hypothetical protein